MRHLGTLLAGIALVCIACTAQAAEYTINVSLDTSAHHVRNEFFHQYAAAIEKKSDGQVALHVYDSASKFAGPNVVTALAQGAIDMGAPAQQHISKFVPNAGILLLSMFYGVGLDQIHGVVDGPLGDELNREIEQKLHVVVLGKPLDLGYGTVFTTDKKLTKPSDLEGMKVRVPGGAATLARYRVFGSTPVQIAWTDVPQALQTGVVPAIWATQHSVASAQLWDAGLHHAFEDKQAFVEYVPMLSSNAWNRLPAKYQTLLRTTWNDMVGQEREAARQDQQEAQQINAAYGIETVNPQQADLDAMREKLLEAQPEIVKTLRMDADFVKRVHDSLQSNG